MEKTLKYLFILLAAFIVVYLVYQGTTVESVSVPGFLEIVFGPPQTEDETSDSVTNSNQSSAGNSNDTTSTQPSSQSEPVVTRYLMDNDAQRTLELTALTNEQYRLKDTSSRWSWEGTGTLSGGILSGVGTFTDSGARMNIKGILREEDDSFVIKYEFIGSDRVDEHVWYPIQESRRYSNYLMDNNSASIVVVTRLSDGTFRIEQPSGSWPWEGEATISGNMLDGIGKFRNSSARMRVEGIRQSDGSYQIKYRFINDSAGNDTDRVDEHIWYPM